ncbi:MAG: DNA recombination protein RmuC [Alphaproteobacteria bacterium]|nr:DNA recombination protein RmuC [Alphaproteobacteria bacterium]
MEHLISFLFFLCGLGLGCAIAFFVMRTRLRMTETFKALAADTLYQNSQAFLQMAEGKLEARAQESTAILDKKTTAIDALVKPVQETLQKMNEQIQSIELKREGAYRELAQMVSDSHQTQTQLRSETSQLLQALRAPSARGRWGELQLQRILEMTGMSAHAQDFTTQMTVRHEDGAIRPDVVVAMPGERCVVIDSKVPLSAYLDSVQAQDDAGRHQALQNHAQQLKDHIKILAGKAYWNRIEGTPEFVVLFLPGEHFLSAALDIDRDLLEFSANQKVVLATPMTLIALLRTAAYGWRQEKIHENMKEMIESAHKLHKALGLFVRHMGEVGGKLGGAVDVYNKMIGSFERNVLPKARKFESCSGMDEQDSLENPKAIESQTPRLVG